MVPTNPILRAKDTAGEILGVAAEVLRMCADGLMEQNAKTIAESLHLARDTQAKIDALRNDLRGGHEISRISPLHWNTRAKVARLAEIADPLDNAVRNIRVLVRRSLSLVRDDEILDPRLVDEVEKVVARRRNCSVGNACRPRGPAWSGGGATRITGGRGGCSLRPGA